jgi:streptogramin lyase
VAVATGLHAIWVLDDGSRFDRLLRLDPATGKVKVQARLPVASRLSSMTVGFGDLWLVGERTALLYRVDPRSGSVHHVILGRRAGRPAALQGNIWVGVTNIRGGETLLVDPSTLLPVNTLDGGVDPTGIGTNAAGAFRSVWGYDVADGEVQRWHPPNLAGLVDVTHAPKYDGSCMTSLVAGGGAIWVTLAPSLDYTCNFL